MARHDSLPQSFTPEQLGDYIRGNRVETQNHIEKIPLTAEEKQQYAMESSLASRQITKLESLLKEFGNCIKKGTPWNSSLGTDGDHVPLTYTIPPTKGIEKLKANREFADLQIEKGYREEITPIYLMPWPEQKKMVAVDIEGNEWSKYSRVMTFDEVRQHGKPILEAASQEVKDILEENGLEVEQVKGKTVRMKKREMDKQPPLSDDELRELDEDDINL